jgi:hypothetical protein
VNLVARALRNKRATASALTIALIVGVPVTFAALHPGFPVSDVQLNSRDVWTTNARDLLAGRLNKQIDALNGSVRTASASFDVFQDGDDVFLEDQRNFTLERIDPSYTTLSDPVPLPPGAQLGYGGKKLAILAPDSGDLWIVDASSRLEFDAGSTEPTASIGKGAQAVVTRSGVVLAVSPKGTLYRFPVDGGRPQKSSLPALSDFQLSAVGDHAVVLDTAKNRVVKEDGSSVDLDATGVRIQQVGPDSDSVLIATADSLLRVSITGGKIQTIPADITAPPGTASTAPVYVNGCAHAAWADAQRYLLACDGKEPRTQDITQQTSGSDLEFRVNRSVVVLNNLSNGDAWVLDDTLQLVDNWDEVTPPQDDDSTDGDQDATKQSFEDTLAERTEKNHPPTVVNDKFGVRPGKTTILPVLDNDSDVDGDVLTISGVSDISASIGHLELIDSGRALQFTPAEGAVGGTSLRYTASDGRSGGIAQGTVDISIRSLDQNLAPVASRSGAVIVEAGQSVTYNVLADWVDPDGDDLQVVAATPDSGDTVRFTPDGFVTFQHTSSELGVKQVAFTVSDGSLTAEGTLAVDVKAAGTLNPIGVPDFATGFVGDEISIAPLKNDRSPSGAPLQLLAVQPLEGGGTFTPNLDRGTVVFSAGLAGTYYLEYTVGAGRNTSIGVIRIDVVPDPEKPLPPIAVKDVAYLRASQPTVVPVLDNDLSPSGRVLAIQTVDVPPEAQQLSVEVLSNTELRITSATPLTSQLQLSYTISDGLETSSAGITIVPVAPLVKHQAPIAVDDLVTVRAGDIASVEVLKNDFHPDGVAMILAPDLPDPGSAGLAFVTGSAVRFQAPQEPGQYTVTYKVTDEFEESAIGRVIFTVTAPDSESNRAPLPAPIVARVFAGADLTVKVPLQGIDPDGDSVSLVAIPGAPLLGEIVDLGSDYFVYRAGGDSADTDRFTYQVIDAYGATAIGSIQIGVVPRSGSSLPPVAVNDAISLRPDRVASVDVLANDSDPNGYAIQVDPKTLVVPKGITAKVVDNRVVVEASDEEGPFAIDYTLTNGHGGTATAVINLLVSEDAPPQYPTAIDHVLQAKDIAGKTTVPVNVLDGAQNPGGRVKDLVVAVLGPNASAAVVKGDGTVEVTPGTTRMAIAYSLTNAIDDLTSTAFVIVPPAPKDGFADPPILKPDLVPQTMNVNETKSWQLKDIVFVPSGRPALLTDKSTVVATHSNGKAVYTDATTLTFTPEKDYRGTATIQFEVTDGSTAKDPNGNRATLTLVVTVGDPNFEDVAPTFTPPSVKVEAGGSTTIDLRKSTAHPSQKVIAAIQYGGLSAQNNAVAAQLSGSNLTLSAPRTAKVGTIVKYTFTLTFKSFTVKGSVTATVVSSLKPHAQAVTDALHAVRNVVKVVSPLANDVNPFPDTPLKIIDAKLENPASGAAISNTASTITVTPGPSFIGDVSVVYTVQDATGDASRNVTGRVIVTVWDVPDRMAAPTISGWGDGTVTVQFAPPPSINGSEVTKYTVRSSPAVSAPTCNAGAACKFTGLVNGTAYTFFVTATNEVGASQESPASASATPYRTPSAPASASLSASGYAPATLNMSWGAPGDSGGGVSNYKWEFTKGASDTGSTPSRTASIGNKATGTYAFHVQACNPAGCSGWTQSGNAVVENQPTTVTLSAGPIKSGTSTAHAYHIVATGFTPNSGFTVACYARGGNIGTAGYWSDTTTPLKFDGSGNFNGDVSCWDGFGGAHYAVIGAVTSNSVIW